MRAQKMKEEPGRDPDGLKSLWGQLYEGLKKMTVDDLKRDGQLWSVEYVGMDVFSLSSLRSLYPFFSPFLFGSKVYYV